MFSLSHMLVKHLRLNLDEVLNMQVINVILYHKTLLQVFSLSHMLVKHLRLNLDEVLNMQVINVILYHKTLLQQCFLCLTCL